MSRFGTVSARAPSLLRLTHQLVGDPRVAADLVARVISRRRVRHALDHADDEVVVAALVREALRNRTAVADGTRLAALPRRERVAVVLAFALGWDPAGIAEAMGTSARRAHADVRRGLALAPEHEWRQLLADDQWDVTDATGVDRRSAAAARVRHARQRTGWLAACVALTLLVGVVDVTVRVVTAPPPLPPTAHGHGLLSWTPRGALVRDERFRAAATSIWRRSAHPPAGPVYVLYAGHIGDGRIAVLQAAGSSGAHLAVVADHDVTFRHPKLKLDLVAPLPRGDVPVLTVPYDGNLGIPGLTTGPGSRVLQALVAPPIDQIDERSSRAPDASITGGGFISSVRPGFRKLSLHDGLTDPWLDLSGSLPFTAVRAFRHGDVAFTGLVDPHGMQPRPVGSNLTPTPTQWAGVPHDMQPETLADDVLWWNESCRGRDTSVSLIWSGSVRAVSTVVRLELVQCAGQPMTARWVKGGTDGAEWFGESVGSAAAYGVVVPPDSLAPATLVVIGSTAVHEFAIGGVRVASRVARARATGAGLPSLVARSAKGRSLPVSLGGFAGSGQ